MGRDERDRVLEFNYALVLDSDGRPQALRCRMHEDSYIDGRKTAEFLRKLLAEFQGPLIVV